MTRAQDWLDKRESESPDKFVREGNVDYDRELVVFLMDEFAAARCAQVEAQHELAIKSWKAEELTWRQLNHEQAIKIQQMQAGAEELLEANRWIPVEEKLPEPFVYVQCHRTLGEPSIVTARMVTSESVGRPWWEGYYGHKIFTHWRQLPEPPAAPSREGDNGPK